MKSDEEIIYQAYEEALRNVFSVYYRGAVAEPEESEERFLKGLHNVRKARDKALELISKE
jgi:hypothetical protein